MSTVERGLSGKQLAFMRGSTARVNVLEGSIRSGKTIVSLLRWLIFIARAPRGGELVMIGRTRDSVWRNTIAPLQDPALFGIFAAQVVGNHGAPTVHILGRTVHVLGASDAKAEKVIRGLTVAGAYVDELTTIPEEFFTQLLGRMSVAGAQLFGTTNPDNPAHWLRTKFLDRLASLPDWSSWHFTLDDNPALSDEYKASIKAEFTGLWYQRFILGRWVAAEGAIFDMWDPTRHVITYNQAPPVAELVAVGVDYGTTNPTHAVLLALTAELRPRLLVLDEWRYAAQGAEARWTDAQLSTGLRAWLGAAQLEHGMTPRWVFLDPAAASFHTQLRADHVPGLMGADNDVTYGIRTTANLFATSRLAVTDRCPHLIREIPGYAWDPKATAKGEDKPIKVADHGIDAMRYSIVSSERYWHARLFQP